MVLIISMKVNNGDTFSILRSLKERIVERESQSSAKLSLEEKTWEKLWSRVGPNWFLHACSYGSVDAVKFFVEEMGCSVNYEE